MAKSPRKPDRPGEGVETHQVVRPKSSGPFFLVIPGPKQFFCCSLTSAVGA